MTTHHVTSDFAAGTTGTVVFDREEWLNDNGTLIPPATVTATITDDAIDQVLRATNEVGVSPAGQNESWVYKVAIRVDGENELVGTLALTGDVVLGDAIVLVST